MKIGRLSRKGELSVRPQIYDDDFDFQYVDRELLLKAIIIWLCEGTKQSEHNRRVEVVNSDPRIIKTFIRFLRTIKVNEKKIRLKLKVPKNKEERARSYWSKLLHVDSHLFNQSTRPKSRKNSIYQHGTLTVRYHSKRLLEEMGEIANTLIR